MPHRLPRHRYLTTAARWPVGVALTSWRYLWRTTPVYRSEHTCSRQDVEPPPLPDSLADEDVQRSGDGSGALFRLNYSVCIRGSELSSEQLIRRLRSDPDDAAPSEFATFQKVGEEGPMHVGDEYVVRMPGPWDGPVRVVDVGPTSFRLATLAGHLEAGQIEFRAEQEEDRIEFEIESWARSGDRFSDLLYDRLRISKEVQLHMWTSFLERTAKLAGGRRDGAIRIETRRLADD